MTQIDQDALKRAFLEGYNYGSGCGHLTYAETAWELYKEQADLTAAKPHEPGWLETRMKAVPAKPQIRGDEDKLRDLICEAVSHELVRYGVQNDDAPWDVADVSLRAIRPYLQPLSDTGLSDEACPSCGEQKAVACSRYTCLACNTDFNLVGDKLERETRGLSDEMRERLVEGMAKANHDEYLRRLREQEDYRGVTWEFLTEGKREQYRQETRAALDFLLEHYTLMPKGNR